MDSLPCWCSNYFWKWFALFSFEKCSIMIPIMLKISICELKIISGWDSYWIFFLFLFCSFQLFNNENVLLSWSGKKKHNEHFFFFLLYYHTWILKNFPSAKSCTKNSRAYGENKIGIDHSNLWKSETRILIKINSNSNKNSGISKYTDIWNLELILPLLKYLSWRAFISNR